MYVYKNGKKVKKACENFQEETYNVTSSNNENDTDGYMKKVPLWPFIIIGVVILILVTVWVIRNNKEM